jgi:hypothetical protein
VTHAEAQYVIVAVNPARVVKYRCDEEITEGLLSLNGWSWNEEEIKRVIPEMLN